MSSSTKIPMSAEGMMEGRLSRHRALDELEQVLHKVPRARTRPTRISSEGHKLHETTKCFQSSCGASGSGKLGPKSSKNSTHQVACHGCLTAGGNPTSSAIGGK